MICIHCKQRGKPKGITYTDNKKIPWVNFICENKNCRFMFPSAIETNKDGTPLIKEGKPKWSFPMKDIK